MINNVLKDFLTAWPNSKAELDKTMQSNKKWNTESTTRLANRDNH